MFLEKIRSSIGSLLAKVATFSPEVFKEKLYCAYQAKLLADLWDALKAEDAVSALKAVLAQNWSLVKGTFLCYTARPNDDLTQLLCDVAHEISLSTKEAPIQILMPSIYTESVHDNYPNLDKLPLQQVLNTHILSTSGHYLIPLRVLNDLPAPWEASQPLSNYYYDYRTHLAEETHINEKERQRLFQHSIHTQALQSSQEEYNQLNENAGLLGRLQTLIRNLRFNSTAGRGREEAAGQGAYSAIIAFMAYYEQLGEIKDRIPEPVRKAIEYLLVISSNPKKNDTATANTQTCIHTRQEELSRLLKAHEAELMAISINDEHKYQLLAEAKARFNVNKATLVKKLEERSYQEGQDKLEISLSLLEQFHIIPTITSPAELRDFLTLSRNEIISIAANEASVREGILTQLPVIEAWALFCLQTPLEPLEAILTVMGKVLVQRKIIRTPNDISACLTMLEGARLERVSQVLLPEIIHNGTEFGEVLRYLNPAQHTAVCEAFKEKLPEIIHNRWEFGQALRYLSPAQCTTLCEAFKAKLPEIIPNGTEFGQVLRYLFPEECTAVCEVLKEELLKILHNGSEIGQALSCLTPAHCTVVCEALKANFLKMIGNWWEFGQALRYLTPEQCTVLCKALKEKLSEILHNGTEFGIAISCLTPEQCTAVCEALKTKLPEIISNGSEFGQVLFNLTTVQRTAVYEVFKEKLPEIIHNETEFGQALRYLTPEQCTVLCEALKAKFPEIIHNETEFGQALSYLTPEQCTVVCKTLKAKFLNIIHNGTEFEQVLRYLSPDKCAAVYEVFKEKLPEIIHNETEFKQVLRYLTPAQCTTLCEALKEKLPEIIHNETEFKQVLRYLTPAQCSTLCEALKEKLSITPQARSSRFNDDAMGIEDNPSIFTPYQNRIHEEEDAEESENKDLARVIRRP